MNYGVILRTLAVYAAPAAPAVNPTFLFTETATYRLHRVDSQHVAPVKYPGRPLNWPSTAAGRWCDHCCHPFDGPPVPLPVSWDSRRDIFRVRGMFCSFACALAYNRDSLASTTNTSVRAELLTLMRKKMTGKYFKIRSAPSRCALKVFGGCMTIEEFRSGSESATVLPPKMILEEQILEIRKNVPKSRARALSDAPVVYEDLPRNETLKLKRMKPLPKKNQLDRMGFKNLFGAA